MPEASNETVAAWLDSIRDRIAAAASLEQLKSRDFAATLVAILIDNNHALVVHVGDGAVVIRDRDSGAWSVPSWPFHGEYAATTNFVVDDPTPCMDVIHITGAIDRFAVFSDGLEYHVLDFAEKSVPVYYYDEMMRAVLAWEGAGRIRHLSKPLREYLDGEKICNVTDDDKSLILGVRG